MNSKTIVCFIFSIRIHANNRESPPAFCRSSRNPKGILKVKRRFLILDLKYGKKYPLN